jgi:hypothetical protein
MIIYEERKSLTMNKIFTWTPKNHHDENAHGPQFGIRNHFMVSTYLIAYKKVVFSGGALH